MNRLDRIPDRFRESIFEKLFSVAEIAKFTPDEHMSYEDSLKVYRDMKNSLDTAREEGLIEGIEKGKEQGSFEKMLSILKKGLDKGYSLELLSDLTELGVDKIEELIKKHNLK